MKNKQRICFTAMLVWSTCVAFSSLALAEQKPKAGQLDARIRTVAYRENDVVAVQSHYGISTLVVFADEEIIETITLGDTKSWLVEPNARQNMVFLKPVEPDAASNMNIVTNRRIYNFALNASDSQNKKEQTFTLRFTYPEDEIDQKLWDQAKEAVANPNLADLDAAHINHSYAYKGDGRLRPVTVFDDGQKTYLKFKGPIPAIFTVGDKGQEKVVNFRRSQDFIIIDGIHAQLTLRRGKQTTCLFNLKDQNSVMERKQSPTTADEIHATHGDNLDSMKKKNATEGR